MRRLLIFAAVIAFFVAAGVIGAYFGRESGGDGASADGPALEGTPVEALKDCPWGEALCILAQGIERALEKEDVAAVLEFAVVRQFECPGVPPTGPGGPFPLCEGVPRFEARDGLPIGRRFSEGFVVDREGLRRFIAAFVQEVRPDARDRVGSGELELYAMSCEREAVAVQNVSCARAAIIFSAIIGQASSQRRELLIFWAVPGFMRETLPVESVWTGIVMDDEIPIIFQRGGRLFDLGQVHVLDR
jgi:hypothetical protein